ncbi:MAG: tyrosine-type recombinase/integrase [Treponematales bacterium]
MADYHIFRKIVAGKGGKKVHRWYFYRRDAAGKKKFGRCKGCNSVREAEAYIERLAAGGAPPDTRAAPLIRDIAGTMYIPGGPHYERRRQLGKSVDMATMKEARVIVEKIIADFGYRELPSITAAEVTNLLFASPRSGSRKNRYIQVFREIYREAEWYGVKTVPPNFPAFARNVKKADVFSTEELNALFKPDNFPGEDYYLLFLCCLSGGLRLGEGRGIRAKQILFERKALVVDGYCRQNGERTNYNKKGSPSEPKFRVVFLPDKTLERLKAHIEARGLSGDDFCFTKDGRPLRSEHAETVFFRAMVAAGIMPAGRRTSRAPDGRKLVTHSLRYTYVTRMRRELSAEELMPMTGHVSVDMIDYYDRKTLDTALAALPQGGQAAADGLFR